MPLNKRKDQTPWVLVANVLDCDIIVNDLESLSGLVNKYEPSYPPLTISLQYFNNEGFGIIFWFVLVLGSINHCRLFNAKSILKI